MVLLYREKWLINLLGKAEVMAFLEKYGYTVFNLEPVLSRLACRYAAYSMGRAGSHMNWGSFAVPTPGCGGFLLKTKEKTVSLQDTGRYTTTPARPEECLACMTACGRRLPESL